MNYSRHLATQNMNEARRSAQAPQLPELPLPLSLRGPHGRKSVASSLDGDSLLSSTAALQEPFDQPDLQYLSVTNGNGGSETMANNKQQNQPAVMGAPGSGRSSFMKDTPARQPARKARYYSHALSDEDKQALSMGEKNHNLKEWTPKDLVNHHEARRNLVPRAMDKLDKTNALAGIEKDKKDSQRALSKWANKVRRFSKLPRIKVTSDGGGKDDEPTTTTTTTYTQPHHGSQSMYDFRSLSPPAAPQLSPVSISPLALADQAPLLDSRAAHTRAASSSGDYFSRPARPLSSHASSGHSSGTSTSRVRLSPLSQEVQPFRHNPQVTFDAFLAPHKLGKGEAYRDSDNAKKLKTLEGEPKDEPAGSPMSSKRRLSKMPSMPILRKRSPRLGASGGE